MIFDARDAPQRGIVYVAVFLLFFPFFAGPFWTEGFGGSCAEVRMIFSLTQ
jgi:hypothetical protein